MDTDYAGTFSSLDASNRTARERRGKYRANKRKPRTSNSAASSECITFHVSDLDSNNRPTRGSIFKPKRERVAAKAQRSLQQPDVLRLAHIIGYTGNVD